MTEEKNEKMNVDEHIERTKIDGFRFECPDPRCRKRIEYTTYKAVRNRARQHVNQSKNHPDVVVDDHIDEG